MAEKKQPAKKAEAAKPAKKPAEKPASKAETKKPAAKAEPDNDEIVEIKSPDVRTWWSSMDPATPTVRARAYGVLKAVMNTAVADDLIDANPCRIRGASNAPRARDVRPATVKELAVIVEAMPDRYRALVLLGAWCALRSGEMLELRRRDVDLVNGTVRVERAVSQVHGRAVVGTPKSAAGIRTVAIPPHVVPALAHHLKEFVAPGPEVATQTPGRPVARAYPSAAWAAACSWRTSTCRSCGYSGSAW